MKGRLTWLVLLSATGVVTAFYHAGNVLGTPASGFSGTTLAVGQFDDITVVNHVISPDAREEERKLTICQSQQKTKGLSDLYVQSNVWAPGGSTGWHTHPAHSLIIVTAGKGGATGGGETARHAKRKTPGGGVGCARGGRRHPPPPRSG